MLVNLVKGEFSRSPDVVVVMRMTQETDLKKMGSSCRDAVTLMEDGEPGSVKLPSLTS